MLRSALHDHYEETDSDGFRLRGLGASRLDSFSDVVFGFALTLLVVALEVPRSFAELHHLLGAFLPFAISFLLLMLVWYGHYTYFRYFGTHDAGTIWLNGVLLFVVLFYVYPLKFLFLNAFNQSSSSVGGNEMREVVLLYSSGFSAIYILFAALYANAYRQRDRLDLSPVERMLTRNFIVEETGTAVTGVTVCVTAMLLPAGKTAMACLLFMFIGVWKSIMGARCGRAARRMREAELHNDAAIRHNPESDTASMASE